MDWSFQPGSMSRIALIIVAIVIFVVYTILEPRNLFVKIVLLCVGIAGLAREWAAWRRRGGAAGEE